MAGTPDEPIGPIEVDNAELLTPRDFRREFSPKLEALTLGDLDKLVLLQRNQMVAVVLPYDRYVEMLELLAASEVDA